MEICPHLELMKIEYEEPLDGSPEKIVWQCTMCGQIIHTPNGDKNG
jgi:hypothetical protein